MFASIKSMAYEGSVEQKRAKDSSMRKYARCLNDAKKICPAAPRKTSPFRLNKDVLAQMHKDFPKRGKSVRRALFEEFAAAELDVSLDVSLDVELDTADVELQDLAS